MKNTPTVTTNEKSQVEQQLILLEQNIDRLGTCLSDLEARLTRVLMSGGPDQADKVVASQNELVPLASELEHFNRTLQDKIAFAYTVLQRIQL